MTQLILSLFPGIGLLDRAFEEEGFTVVRGPDVLWGGDIRTFHPPAGKFDGVIGGPPCQMFSSLARLVIANGHKPRFGNLIPEFERCVAAAAPAWFLMENVPQAPVPVVEGYGVKPFMLDNSMLNAGDGWGEEQRRVRRFCFGQRGVVDPPSLLRWIDLAVFLLPDAGTNNGVYGKGDTPSQRTRKSTATQWTPNNSKEAKRRHVAVTSTDGGVRPSERTSKAAVFGDGRATRQEVRKGQASGKGRYRLPDACRLQGLPEDFLSDAPFTAEGKLKAVANGVPLPMGRAIAKAVREAIGGGA